MDPREESVDGPGASDVDAAPDTTPEGAVESAQDEPGQTSGADVITLGLFGVMVIISSVCFVIW